MGEGFAMLDPVELTRRANASGGGEDFDAMMDFFGPESTLDMSHVGLGTYRGLVAIRRFVESWIGSCDQFEILLEEVLDLGDGVVFALARQNALPAGAKDLLELRYAAVYVWVDGVSVRVSNYRDIDGARAAAEQLADSRRAARLQRNVESLRAVLQPMDGIAWDSSALSDFASRITLFDQEVVYEDATMFDETFHGHAGVLAAFRRWTEAFASTRVSLVDIVGDRDTVVSIHRFQAAAHRTGIEFKGEYAYLWTFQDGRVVRYRSVTEPAEALKAAGLLKQEP